MHGYTYIKSHITEELIKALQNGTDARQLLECLYSIEVAINLPAPAFGDWSSTESSISS